VRARPALARPPLLERGQREPARRRAST
jgi:hypothetical protein